MDQIIAFNKTNEERLNEYEVVFFATKLQSLPEIKKQWSVYLELKLDVLKWQAFWKIPASECRANKIPYPMVVLVQVHHIDYTKLVAFVEIVAVQGDQQQINCDVEYEASLMHLWPTKQQFVCDVDPVADTLDQLRFFYNHIVMPWDYLNAAEALIDIEERLQFHYHLKNKPKCKTVKARALLKHIQNQSQLSEIDHDADLHLKILELKNEYDLIFLDLDTQNKTNNTWLIFQNKSNIKAFIEYLEMVKLCTTINSKYETAVSLEYALDAAMPNDTIYINKGVHCLNLSGIIRDNLTLKGVSESTEINTRKDNTIFEFMSDELCIENVHLKVDKACCALIGHSGQISIKNCIISAVNNPNAEHGIIALANSKLILENCKISGFNVGVYAASTSCITLINCSISDVSTAIHFFDNTQLRISNSMFKNNLQSFYLESNQEVHSTGDENLLNKSYINIDKCKYEDCSTIVVIKNKRDIFDA